MVIKKFTVRDGTLFFEGGGGRGGGEIFKKFFAQPKRLKKIAKGSHEGKN